MSKGQLDLLRLGLLVLVLGLLLVLLDLLPLSLLLGLDLVEGMPLA